MLLIFVVFYESSKVLFTPQGSVGPPQRLLPPLVRRGTEDSLQRSLKMLISLAFDVMLKCVNILIMYLKV